MAYAQGKDDPGQWPILTIFNGIEDIYNKELYLIASRTAPLGEHYRTTLTKQVDRLEEKNCGTVKFEQILPKVYDVK